MIGLRCVAFRASAQHALLRRPQTSPLRTIRRRHASSGKQKSPETTRPPHTYNETAVESKAEPIDIPSLVWYQRLGPVTDFFSWFNRMQFKRPYTVQLCTILTTYLFGDLLAQEIGGEKYDSKRTIRMLFIGSLSAIPGYKWFLFLGNHFNYPSKVLSIAIKVVVQQAVFSPVFNTYFFGMQAALTGISPSGVIDRVKKAVPESLVNSAKFWPIVTAFSFAFISPHYRFMFSGVFAVIWQTYLSYLNRREERNLGLPMAELAS